MKLPKILKGYKRAYYQCRSCRKLWFHDFVPYGLGRGIYYDECLCVITGNDGGGCNHETLTRKEWLRRKTKPLKIRV